MLTNVQLGLYQLAVDHGAADDGRRRRGRGGRRRAGAARAARRDAEHATVQQQPEQADDGPERTALRDRLARAASLLRTESFPAVAGQHCRDCDFVPICPIKSAGSVVAS